jgi:glycosyltransferase involved in cell wall biosynthesis
MLEGKLEIFIITFNRAKKLEETLLFLSDSILKNCKLTILNNCSKDDTLAICESFKTKFSNFSVVTNPINIGPSANVLRSYELSDSKYTWILCDDDYLNLDKLDDVFEKIEEGVVDLVHVGAHPEPWILGGRQDNAKNLLKEGYLYFKYSSFLPCNIIRTNLFTEKYMIAAFNNCVNYYPHMPFIQGVYTDNCLLYISKEKIVTALFGNHGYLQYDWFLWWMRTADLFEKKIDRRIFFKNHFNNPFSHGDKMLMAKCAVLSWKNYLELKAFILRNLNLSLLIILDIYILYNYINALYDKLKNSKIWGILLYYKNVIRN